MRRRARAAGLRSRHADAVAFSRRAALGRAGRGDEAVTPQSEAKVLEHLEAIASSLERIAVGVERMTAEPPPTPITGCEHPRECRIELGGMGGSEEWICAVKLGGCGFRYPADVADHDAPTSAAKE